MREQAGIAGVLGVLAAALLALGALAAPATDENWPALRGADGRGVSDATELPLQWSATQNVLWHTPLPGRGHSSPIIWGNRIFLTTAVRGEAVEGHVAITHTISGSEFLHPDSVDAQNRHEYRVLGIDADTGEILWDRLAHEGLPHDNRHRAGSFASPTPITDGERVYAYFGTPGVFAYDMSGELLWSRDLGPMPTLGMGVGTSPVLADGVLVIQADRELGEDSFLVGLDVTTGEELWRQPRQVEVSWTTPTVVQHEGRTELVTTGNQLLVSYDPRSGRELWRMDGLHSNAIHRPLSHDDLVIHTAGYPSKIIKAVRLGGEGDLTGTDRLVWSYNKGTAYVASNLAYRGLVYLLADNGVVTCLDAATGEIVYEGGRPPVPQQFFASPIAWDGKILLSGADGEMFVVRAGAEFEVLATNTLGEPIWATPAIAGGRLYVRSIEQLWAIGNVAPASGAE